jgi:hypothetical protein
VPDDRCSRSSYFDREGFDKAQKLNCPMEGCGYVWCKQCQQEIIPNGPEHSCGGSSELKRPVQQRQDWNIGFSWSSGRMAVDARASVQPARGIRVQLVSTLLVPWSSNF